MVTPLSAKTVYFVEGNSWLSSMDVDSSTVSRIGRSNVSWDDVAWFNNQLFGVGNERFFEISPENGLVRQIGNQLDLSTPWPFISADPKGLTISSEGIAYLVADEFPSGGLFTINLNNGDTRRVGSLPFTPRGDAVFDALGNLAVTGCTETGLRRQCDDSRADDLWSTNPLTGDSSRIGSIKDESGRNVAGVDGLMNVDDRLIGITGRGDLYDIDWSTARATSLGTVEPRILATGATYADTQGAAVNRLESRLPMLDLSANGLIINAHGWTGPFGSLIESVPWVDEMAAAQKDRLSRLPANSPIKWQVIPYHWEELAGGTRDDLTHIMNVGTSLGLLEGGIIGQRQYDHLYIFASSAGAGFGNGLMQEYLRHNPGAQVHIVFADAYTPNQSQVAQYGRGATYAEHWFAIDSTGAATEQLLPGAHNVNVDAFDGLLEFGHFVPRQEYLKTIISATVNPDLAGYGWQQTLMDWTGPIQEWAPWKERPINNGEAVLPALNPPPSGRPVRVDERLDNQLRFTAANVTAEGNVQLGSLDMVLSATPRREALAPVKIQSSQPYNLLSLNVQFSGEAGAEGLLSIGLGGENRWTLDQRTVAGGIQNYIFPLDQDYVDDGTLTFRLVNFTSSETQVLISNVILGRDTVFRAPDLRAGDADHDLDFDQLDIVKVMLAGKYLSGEVATWGEGDWNGAPGGWADSPPPGDGMFDQLDIVAALKGNNYLRGAYAAEWELVMVPEPSTIQYLGWLLTTAGLIWGNKKFLMN